MFWGALALVVSELALLHWITQNKKLMAIWVTVLACLVVDFVYMAVWIILAVAR